MLFHWITPPKAALNLKLFLNGKAYCVFLSPEPKVQVVKFSESFYPSRPICNIIIELSRVTVNIKA